MTIKLTTREKIFYRLVCNEQRVYRHWYSRFILSGVELDRARRVVARTRSWFDWCDQWMDEGNHVLDLADESLRKGAFHTARRLFHEAAGCYHVGQHFFYVDPETKGRTYAHIAPAYAQALGLYDETERPRPISVPFRGCTIPGYLTLRPEAGRPLVVLVNGMDNLKETEIHTISREFFRAGFNTLAFDGPGQGEMHGTMPMVCDYHCATSAMIDWLESGSMGESIDLSRIGAVGFSMGGYLAPVSAANDPRISCVAASGGPASLDLLPGARSVNPILYRCLPHATWQTDYEEARRTLAFDVRNSPALEAPLLLFMSGADRLIPDGHKHAEVFMNWAKGEKRLAFYEKAEHVCADYLDEMLPRMVDWMTSHLVC